MGLSLALLLGACADDAPPCLEGADGDGDGLVVVGYGAGHAQSEYADLPGFLAAEDGLDDSCVVVAVRIASEDGCRERPVVVVCPLPGTGRNIGNAVVYLATAERPGNIHRGDSPYAPAQFNVDACGYQTACMGREAAEPVMAGEQVLGSCDEGPVFVDMFCHGDAAATVLDEHGAAAARVVGESVELGTTCDEATWHNGEELGLEPLPLRERRSLLVTATETTTQVEIRAESELDAGCDLLLGNSRRPFGALEITGPSWDQACIGDRDEVAVEEVPQEGPSGLFLLAEGQMDLHVPMAARLHEGSDGAADVALCLASVSHSVDGAPVEAPFTSYGYAEPTEHPGRAGVSQLMAPYDDWPTWPPARYQWELEGRLVAGPPEASLETLCGHALGGCPW